MTDIVERCKNYIANGGLSNPEHSRFLYGDMLVMDCRDEIERLREALRFIVNETCEYAIINKLGDPEQQHSIKMARAALGEGK